MENTDTLRKSDSITKAKVRAERTGVPYVVIARTAHPIYPGQTIYLVCAERELHTLSADSTVVYSTDPYSIWF